MSNLEKVLIELEAQSKAMEALIGESIEMAYASLPKVVDDLEDAEAFRLQVAGCLNDAIQHIRRRR